MAKSNIGNICIYDNGFFLFEDTYIRHIDKIDKKKRFCGTVISADEIYSYSFTLPSDIEEDRFATSVEIALFEDGKLDIQNSYIIAYTKHLSDSAEVWVVEAFAIEEDRIYQLYSQLASKVKYIDLIAIPYVVYEAYFLKESIESKGIRVIIHIDDKNSFISIYRNGKYIGHQKIYSLEYISKKIGIPLSELKHILTTKGLDESRYSDKDRYIYESIYPLLFDIMRQMERLIRSKSAYFDVSKIASINIDFDDKEIIEFERVIKEYGFSDSKIETLLPVGISGCSSNYDCIKKLYIKYVAISKIEAPNLSPFLREPPLWSRWIGKLAIASVLIFAISIAYGLYMEYRYIILSREHDMLISKLNKIEKEVSRYKKEISAKKKILTKHKIELSKNQKELLEFSHSLKKVLDIKEFTILRQKMMKDVDKILERYSLMVLAIDQNGSKSIKVDLIVPFKSREDIALFMKDMKSLGYKSVNTDEITLEKDLYKSSIKISR